jgi:hypothetical protein
LSGDEVCQICTSPEFSTVAMIGRVGCHWCQLYLYR